MPFWRKLLDMAKSAGGRMFDRDGQGFPEDRQVDNAGFAAALIALAAKMAKADGLVTRDEILAFRQIFDIPEKSEDDVARLFNLYRETTLGFEAYAAQVARRFRCCPFLLEDVLDGLFHIARADGTVTETEEEYLKTVSDIFGFSSREYRRIRASRLGREPDDPYLILGVDEDISDADLKTAYRRMAALNHPDRVAANGMPSELQSLAHAKMAMINLSYEKIIRERELDRQNH